MCQLPHVPAATTCKTVITPCPATDSVVAAADAMMTRKRLSAGALLVPAAATVLSLATTTWGPLPWAGLVHVRTLKLDFYCPMDQLYLAFP